VASYSSRSREERSPRMVFIQVVCGHPSGHHSPALGRRLKNDLDGVSYTTNE